MCKHSQRGDAQHSVEPNRFRLLQSNVLRLQRTTLLVGVPATCKVNDIPQEPNNGSGGRLGGEEDGQDQWLRPFSAVSSLKLQLWDT